MGITATPAGLKLLLTPQTPESQAYYRPDVHRPDVHQPFDIVRGDTVARLRQPAAQTPAPHKPGVPQFLKIAAGFIRDRISEFGKHEMPVPIKPEPAPAAVPNPIASREDADDFEEYHFITREELKGLSHPASPAREV